MTTYLQLVLEDGSDASLTYVTKSLPFLTSFFLNYLVEPWQNLSFEMENFYLELLEIQIIKKLLIQVKIMRLGWVLFHLFWRIKITSKSKM